MSTSSLQAIPATQQTPPDPATPLESARPARAPRAKVPSEVRQRVKPGRPVGKLLGGVLAALGLGYSLAVMLAGPDLIPWYWAPNAPEFNALAGGFLLAAGILVLLWRFSIRLMMLLIILAGAFGLVGQQVGRHTALFHRTNIASHDTKMLEQLFNEGIAGTLAERGVFDKAHPPFRAYYDFQKRLCVETYPHADPRVLRMPQAIETFVFKMEGVDSKGNYRDSWFGGNCLDAVVYLQATLAKRFGDEHARAVMAQCAEIVRDARFKAAFLNAAAIPEPPLAADDLAQPNQSPVPDNNVPEPSNPANVPDE